MRTKTHILRGISSKWGTKTKKKTLRDKKGYFRYIYEQARTPHDKDMALQSEAKCAINETSTKRQKEVTKLKYAKIHTKLIKEIMGK